MTESIDVEYVLGRLLTLMQDNLNTKLTAITTQKGDGLTLKTFTAPSGSSPGAYAMVTTDAYVMNFNPWLYIGPAMPETAPLGPATASQLDIDLIVVLSTAGLNTDAWKHLMRYQRALKEIIQENWRMADIPGDFMIENLEPRPIADVGSDNYMGVGIRVRTHLA